MKTGRLWNTRDTSEWRCNTIHSKYGSNNIHNLLNVYLWKEKEWVSFS
jgi:hypothetical protein